MSADAVAYLIRNCPNFWFMPSMKYDRAFEPLSENLAKWIDRGLTAEPLYESSDSVCDMWFVTGVGEVYLVYSLEAAEAARSLGKPAIPVTTKVKR